MPLVFEATMKSVSLSTFAGLPSSRTPKPPSKTTLPPVDERDAPRRGRPSSRCAASTKSVICLMRSSSSGCAFFPANDSRA